MRYEKFILVTRKTRLEELIERFNTRAQAKFYIEHSQGDFAFYEREHAAYQDAFKTLYKTLQSIAKVQVIERGFLPNFIFAPSDLVVTLGIDGLVVNTAKYLQGQPILAVNPDPKNIYGVLLPFDVPKACLTATAALQGQSTTRPITMAEAVLNDGQRLLAFNDLFIGRHDHVSARYSIGINGRSEQHSSSGIIISTGAGSTGWLSSLFNMANGIVSHFGGEHQPIPQPHIEWETNALIFVVREPFVSKTTRAGIVCGTITEETPLVLESTMPEGGVIFSDGITADYLAFNSGTKATISLAKQRANLIVPV